MTLNFPKSIYTAAEATAASISPANASPSDGDTGTIGSYGFTFDDDRVDSNGRWVLNDGSTYSLASGATYTWDLYKWKASNIPDSSDVVQTTDTPANGEFLKWDNGAAVWAADNDTTYSTATTSADGLMSSTDKSKLNGIETGADVTDATNVAAAGAAMETGATFSGTVDFDSNVTQEVQAVSALNIDCSTGNYFTKTISANSTFTVSNVPSSGTAYSFTLELTHTSGTVTWWTGLEWPGGTAPTLTAGKTHLFVFVTDDGGTRWRGASLVDYTN